MHVQLTSLPHTHTHTPCVSCVGRTCAVAAMAEDKEQISVSIRLRPLNAKEAAGGVAWKAYDDRHICQFSADGPVKGTMAAFGA